MTTMHKEPPFYEHAVEYDTWFDRHRAAFESELNAIRSLWPKGENILSLEIGSGTGRIARALEITECIEPVGSMAEISELRGVTPLRAYAEDLPYQDQQFDVVLMNCCISYLYDVDKALAEAFRVLKKDGYILVSFIDRDSRIGKYYRGRVNTNVFYERAHFFSPEEVAEKLLAAGFDNLQWHQTLFDELNAITSVQPVKPGYGEGSFLLVKASK